MACYLSFIIKSERVFNDIVSHVHFKSGISEGVLYGDVVTTGQWQQVIWDLPNISNYDHLWCTWRSFRDCNLLQKAWFVVARFLLASASRSPSAIVKLLVHHVLVSILRVLWYQTELLGHQNTAWELLQWFLYFLGGKQQVNNSDEKYAFSVYFVTLTDLYIKNCFG